MLWLLNIFICNQFLYMYYINRKWNNQIYSFFDVLFHHRFIWVADTSPDVFPDTWEPHCRDRVHFIGFNKWSSPSSHPLHDHPLYLPGDHMWESQHNHSYQNLVSAPSSYVFFPEPLSHCWHGLFIFCYTQYACKLPSGKKCHLLSWMCHPARFRCFLWVNWELPSGRHGIWSLHSSLQPTALFHQNVHTSPYSVTHNVLHWWFSQCLLFYYLLLFFTLLWTKSSQSFFLRFCSFGGTLLFWHQYSCSCPLIYIWLHHCGHSSCYSCILQLHPHHHPEDAFHRGAPQGLLHLHVPPHSSHSVLRDHHVHLRDAQVQLLNWPEQGGVCVLHGGDPHVEPPHLQPQEQWD